MHPLPKYETIDSLHLYVKFLYCNFIFAITNFMCGYCSPITHFNYLKLSIKHFNIQNKSTPDFPLAYHIKNYPYYNSAHSTSPAPQHYLTHRGKNRDKTGHFCDIFQKTEKRPKYLKK